MTVVGHNYSCESIILSDIIDKIEIRYKSEEFDELYSIM